MNNYEKLMSFIPSLDPNDMRKLLLLLNDIQYDAYNEGYMDGISDPINTNKKDKIMLELNTSKK
jgi:hypothetical protein